MANLQTAATHCTVGREYTVRIGDYEYTVEETNWDFFHEMDSDGDTEGWLEFTRRTNTDAQGKSTCPWLRWRRVTPDDTLDMNAAEFEEYWRRRRDKHMRKLLGG